MKLPLQFLEQLTDQWSGKETQDFLTSMEQPSPVSIRLNPKKITTLPEFEPVPWSGMGFYLSERPSFVADPLWHAGAYYVQDASSMIVGELISQIKSDASLPVRVLDLCGAPGGKATDIISRLDDRDLLVSNDVIKSRSRILYENSTKWGHPNHLVSCNDPKDFEKLPGFFDVLLIDAPCSGEGLFRKDPGSVSEWSGEAVNHCSQRQRRIIWDVWEALAEEGILIYSTCTYNTRENHDILSWMQDHFAVERVSFSLDNNWGFSPVEMKGHSMYQAFPHKVKGEGFSFFAVRKKSAVKERKIKIKRSKADPGADYVNALTGSYLKNDSELYFFTHPKEMIFLSENLNLLKNGLRIGEIKKNKLIPSQELANSIILNKEIYPAVSLSEENVLTYLKNETFDVEGNKGFNIVLFQGVPLGFINHLGGRFNNLYPQNWKIRKQNISKPELILK